MLTWATFREQLRIGILNDNPQTVGKRRWSDAQLLLYLGWAQNTLCAHTALPKTAEIDVTSGESSWDAPTDIYRLPANLMEYGLVSLYPANNGKEIFYNPRDKTKGAGPGSSGNLFYVGNDGKVYLATAAPQSGTLRIRYFAYYPLPSGADEDEIGDSLLYFPDWAQDPIAYLVAAHALAGFSMDAASIKMWAELPEKGSPESNPFRAQQKWFMEAYERALVRVPLQPRVNYYRYG